MTELPKRVSIDTNVFCRWMGDRPNDPRSASCAELVETVLGDGGRILVGAPIIGEVLRWGRAGPIPRHSGIEVIAFDDRAAVLLGTLFPMDALRAASLEVGSSLTHLKYDAMVVACAVRGKSQLHVSLDDDHVALCRKAGLRCASPEQLLQPKQARLFD